VPDERVQAAVAHWAPRFLAQGVDYNDFVRTTSRVERWEQWLEAWAATADVHAGLAREAEEKGRRVSAGEAHLRAALCFHFARFVWLVDLERHRWAARRAVTHLRAAHRHLDPTAERVEVPFPGAPLVANLRRPPAAARPPLVLLVPGLDSCKEEFFHWENVFLVRGMATLSLDGPGQGEFAECWEGLPALTREAFRHYSGAADELEARRRAALLDLCDVLPRLRQPLLVVAGKLDRLIPWEQAERMAAAAPRAELVLYPEGGHVCNNIPYKYRPLVADWMWEKLAEG
jgi:pimeloyl-ACP methyl ester carboxylesterase